MQSKVHFAPIRYRIIGGILQGLNIKFGNFIEQLLRNVVEIDTGVKVMPDFHYRTELLSACCCASTSGFGNLRGMVR